MDFIGITNGCPYKNNDHQDKVWSYEKYDKKVGHKITHYTTVCSGDRRKAKVITLPVTSNGFIITGKKWGKQILYDGKSLVAFDFDVLKGGSLKTAQLANLMIGTRIHQSGGSGLHYLYLVENGEPKNTQQTLTNLTRTAKDLGLKGMDIRGTGGILIAPGTKLTCHAHPYTIVDDRPPTVISLAEYHSLYARFILPDTPKFIKKMRQAFQDIYYGKYQIKNEKDPRQRATTAEVNYWISYWAEYLSVGGTLDDGCLWFNTSGVQPEFDETETRSQWTSTYAQKYLNPPRPISREFYEKNFPTYEVEGMVGNKRTTTKWTDFSCGVEENDNHGWEVRFNKKMIGCYQEGDILNFFLWKIKDRYSKIAKRIASEFAFCYAEATKDETRAAVQECQNLIRQDYAQGREQILTVPKIELPTNIQLEAVLKYVPPQQRDDFETILSVAATPKNVSNPVWLAIIAPPSIGKTYMLEMLNHADISVFTDDFTENSLAAGKPNAGADEVYSLFDDAQHKNLILNDMSSIFSQKEDKIKKFLGSLTTAFGGKYRKHSTGTGIMEFETYLSLIMAMTLRTYKINLRYMSSLGNRFLFLKLHRADYSTYQAIEEVSEEVKQARDEKRQLNVCGVVQEATKRPLPSIPASIDEELFQFVRHSVMIRHFMYAESLDDIEGINRLRHQLRLLIRSRARLRDRAVEYGDFEFVKCLVYRTIPFLNILHKLYEKIPKSEVSFTARRKKEDANSADYYTGRMVKSAGRLGIVTGFDELAIEYEFTKEYQLYMEDVFARLKFMPDDDMQVEGPLDSFTGDDVPKSKGSFLQPDKGPVVKTAGKWEKRCQSLLRFLKTNEWTTFELDDLDPLAWDDGGRAKTLAAGLDVYWKMTSTGYELL